MNIQQDRKTKGGDFDRVIRWLDDEDEGTRERAVTILCSSKQRGLEGAVVELLIEEAMATDKRPEHRRRILDVVQQIGEPLGVAAFFDLLSLLHDPNPSVREKAMAVMWALSPGGRAAASSR